MFMLKICNFTKPNMGGIVRFIDTLSRYSRPQIRVNPYKSRRFNFGTQKDPLKRLIVEPLTQRELVRVHGEDVVPFLQGLITNDMSSLKTGQSKSMYTLFLNKGGRILYDAIMYRTLDPNVYLIECDKEVSNELRRHLRTYRVRRKVQIDSAAVEYRPWVVFNPDLSNSIEHITANRPAPEIFTAGDPRVNSLGMRLITTPEKKWGDLAKLFTKFDEISISAPTTEENYRTHRYRFGIGEGVQDIPPGRSFPFEANADFLHGVSFQKGCYVGQELTARVHHTGVIRKRLMPLRLTVPPPQRNSIIQTEAGANVGIVRGISFDRALALLRVDQALHSHNLMIDGDPCFVEKPKWWPAQIPNNDKMRK